jgi:hypothetical protein
MRMLISLQIPTAFWIGGRITFPTYWMYIGSMIFPAAEPLAPEATPFEDEIAIAKLKEHKKSGIGWSNCSRDDPSRRRTIPSEIHKLTNSIWNRKNCLSSEKSLLLHQFIIIKQYHCCQIHKKCIQHPSLQVKSMHWWNYWRTSV